MFRYCAMTATILASTSLSVAARADIWLAGDDPLVQAQKHKQTPADYMDLFKNGTAWSQSPTSVKVFKISQQFALRATDEQLTAVISELKRRNVALAMETGVLVGSPRCGMGVEGYGAAAAVETAAKRIKDHDGDLAFVSFDEPVWHGHGGQGKTGSGAQFCSDSVEDLVEQVAPKIAAIQKYFPNAQIGDIDPVNGQHADQVADTVKFFQLLNQKPNVKLTFFHADVAWATGGWKPALESLATALHQQGLRVGVICDGGGDAKTNEQWVQSAVQRCQSLASDAKVKPDDFIVQSWEPLPTKMLPSSDPGALTHIVDAVANSAH